ncbi:MAG: DUF1440 domain-containing protein [Acidobacteriaceae bacterium]|nr:DUF1440 domain-containing protein [Acidobacteriaceae bacterium]MBV9500761.1 DUF1440 domain-containing protein [Acidobacteriaceae bacterium]
MKVGKQRGEVEGQYPRPWKSVLAGAVAGLAGSFAMSQFHALLPQSTPPTRQNGEDSTVKVASAISHVIFDHDLSGHEEEIAGPLVHYVFGTGVGALYGTVVEYAKPVQAGWGLAFGTAVWLGAHVLIVPALGLSEPITRSSSSAEAAEFAAHLVYGTVVESVRRVLHGLYNEATSANPIKTKLL